MNFLIDSSVILFVNLGYIHLLLTRKRNIRDTSVIFIINTVITLFGAILSDIFLKETIFYDYAIFILLCTFFVYIHLAFEESTSVKIFTAVTVWLFSISILIIGSCIMGLFFWGDNNTYRSLSAVQRGFIQLIIMPIIFFFRKQYKQMLRLVTNKVINIISLYSIIIFLFLVNYYEFNAKKPIISYGFLNGVMFIIIIILSYIIIFIAVYSVNKNVELQYKFKITDTQIELQKQNYDTLNKTLENYYSFKHDIRYHMVAIKSMLEAKNYIAAAQYMDKLNKSEIALNVGKLCDNFAIDSFLKYYESIAVKNNIDFTVKANIPKEINVDNLDLSIVLGNCIENCIEACKNLDTNHKKYIDIKADIKGLQLIIKIKNSFNGKVVTERDVIRTSKDGQGHGIGLTNVRKVIEKYNGYFKVKYDGNEFEVHIIMNYN